VYVCVCVYSVVTQSVVIQVSLTQNTTFFYKGLRCCYRRPWNPVIVAAVLVIRLSAMKMIHNNDDPRDNTTLLDARHHRLPGHLMLVVEEEIEEIQGVLVEEEKDVDHKVVEVVEVDSKEDVEEGEGVHLKDAAKEDGEEGDGDELSLDEDQLVEEVRCFI
jgi:hypothetical protein